MSQKEAIAKAPERRTRRTPLGTRSVLSVSGKEPGYHYRVVNDVGNRVARLLEQGYEIVPAKDVQIGDKRLGNPSTLGSDAAVQVGGGMTGVVMRQREDWYAEDQASKQDYVNQTEAATKEEALNGTYGKLEISRS